MAVLSTNGVLSLIAAYRGSSGDRKVAVLYQHSINKVMTNIYKDQWKNYLLGDNLIVIDSLIAGDSFDFFD